MSQFSLLGQRRFAPFFATQALAAFNDNAFRYAMVGMATFELALSHGALNSYVNLALALFIIPFFLLSASAGQLAEKFEKARLIRYVKLFEIVAMLTAALGFWTRNLDLLLVVLCMMGVHSTVFGPIKYAIVPQVLDTDELTGGNGLIESSTSLAILAGSLTGNALMAVPDIGPTLAACTVIGVAALGFLASLGIPAAPATAPELKFNFNPFSETWRTLGQVRRNRTVFYSVIGISWFWFFGATLTTQSPAYARDWLGGDASVLNLVLVLFSVGIGIGSLACEKLSARQVNPGLMPLGALGMTAVGIDLYFAHPHAAMIGGRDWLAFLQAAGGWHVALDLALIGAFAGLYIVPLFALVQQRTEPGRLSRVIAGNNILNALFMVLAAALGMLAPRLGLSVAGLITLVAVINVLVLIWLCWRVPEFWQRFVAWLARRPEAS
ncbi:MAG TPA: MFS transporter [Rhodanobacteraceae bacterium]|nr:MFS transporter [Rhodanobacteraceae bacterium]